MNPGPRAPTSSCASFYRGSLVAGLNLGTLLPKPAPPQQSCVKRAFIFVCRKKHSRAYEPAMPGPPPGLGIFSLVSTVCTGWKNALWNTGIAPGHSFFRKLRVGLRALRESVYRWGPSWDEATLRQFPVPCPEASSGQTGSRGEDEVSYSTIVCEGRPGLCSHHRSHIPALWPPCQGLCFSGLHVPRL